MAFKFVLALCFVASVAAGTLDHLEQQHQYQHGGDLGHQNDEHYGPAHYEFQYAVHDEHTGDIKEQKEQREGDKVSGFYSLVEPDGHKRIVHYTADKHSGFVANVQREYVGGHEQQQVAHKIIAAPVVAHKIVAAPIVAQYSDAGHGSQNNNYNNYHGSQSSYNYQH